MGEFEWPNEEAAILARFDRSSPDGLLRSIAAEFRRLHEANARLVAQMEAMVALSAMADRILAATGEEFNADLPAALVITADQYLKDSAGLHPIEYDGAGRPYRWTGPTTHFSFQVFIQRRTPSRFTLGFDEFYVPTAPEEFRCFVDGEPTPVTLARLTDHYVASGLISPRADPGGTSLIFACPRTASPQEAGKADPRKLGVSFRQLAIAAAPGGG